MDKVLEIIKKIWCHNLCCRIRRIEAVAIVLLTGLIVGIFVPNFIKASFVTERQVHATMQGLINTQLEIFYTQYNRLPTGMNNKAWSNDQNPYGYQLYFSQNVPKRCPLGERWIINHATKQLFAHPAHE